jgi:hypothetical protein
MVIGQEPSRPPRPPNPGVSPTSRSWPSGRRARARRAGPSRAGPGGPCIPRRQGRLGARQTPGPPGSPLRQMQSARRPCGRYSIGSNSAPARDAKKGKAVPAPQRKPPSSSSPGPQEGRGRRAHTLSSQRSSLLRPNLLAVRVRAESGLPSHALAETRRTVTRAPS